MSERGETEAYLTAELDSLREALAAENQAAVTRRIEHVRAEAGPETAAVLQRALKEGTLSPPPTQPASTPTTPADSVRKLPPRPRKLLVVFLTVAVVALLIVVAVLVTVIILRPPTTASPPPPQSPSGTGVTTTPPPTTTPTSTTSVAPPVVPSEKTWTPAWSQLKRITLPGEIGEEYGADFDTPTVEHSAFIADLTYYGGQLGFNSDLKGVGPATLPTPQACFSAALQAVGKVHLVPGRTAWCMVTRQGSLVWLHLLSGGGTPDLVPTLTFELMRWIKSS